MSRSDGAPAPQREEGGMLLLTLALGFVMAMIDVTAVNVALPDISMSLHVPLTGLVWVVDGYTLTFAALLLAGGALADRVGPKKIYLAGLGVFVVASIACGTAQSGFALIAARLLQGVGAAMFMPSSLSLMAHAFHDDRVRARMLGVWSALVGTAASIGPLVGGALVHAFGWRGVFWINVPVGIVAIAMAYRLIAASPRHDRELSFVSHLAGMAFLGALSFFLIEGPALGWMSTPVVTAAIAALLAIGLLIWREQSGAHPLVPHGLLRAHGFAATNGVGFLINFSAFGQLFLLSLYFQQAHGADSLGAGLLLLPAMASITTGNFLAGRITAKVGVRKPMLIGLSLAALFGLFLIGMREHSSLALMLAIIMALNLPLGIAVPAMTTAIMQIAGRPYANSAAAALNANRQIGALVGVAMVGTILHMVPDWDTRLPIVFGLFAVGYGCAAFLVYRFIAVPAPGAAATARTR